MRAARELARVTPESSEIEWNQESQEWLEKDLQWDCKKKPPLELAGVMGAEGFEPSKA